MPSILKNSLAVLLGIIIGGFLNGQIINLGPSIIPPPEGFDLTKMEDLKSAMHLMTPKHFIFPFLAHAVGSFIGGLIAALVAKNHKMKFALAIGCVFLVGGIIMVIMLPSPLWFTLLDLLVAYIPFAYFGGRLMTRKSK